ncbi:MAG: hypothetical protein AAF333_01865 [Planctomycetota bacterium]
MNHPTPHCSTSLFTTALTTLAAVVVAGFSGAASAQPLPFEAQVIENTVMVRSGAGRAYYEVGQLQRGDRVVVEDELFGWYKIQCPAGVFCFVDRKNVDAKGDGSRGVVNTDATPVNAAHATKGPDDSYRKLDDLNAGDIVQIVANVNNAYKILPPENTYVFLPPNSIEAVRDTPDEPDTSEAPAAPATPEPAQPVAPAQPEPPAVVETPAPPAVVVPEPAQPAPVAVEAPESTLPMSPVPEMPAVAEVSFDEPAPVASPSGQADLLNDPDVKVPLPDVAVTTQASNELLRAVEVAILPYFTLPVDEQPIAKMVRGYADAAQIDGLSDNDLTIIRTRLTELERNRELAEAMRQIEATNAEVNDGQPPVLLPVAIEDSADDEGAAEPPTLSAEGENPEAPATDAAPETAATPEAPVAPIAPVVPSSEYDAVGILTASTVHTGGNQPQLFRLLDPTGRRTVAYLEPGEAVDTVQMLGRLVGIVGDSVYDPSTKLNLIQPQRIDVLNAR